MDEITRTIQDRFPLLERLEVNNIVFDNNSETLPPYLGMVMSVLRKPPRIPVCFVHPRWSDIGRLIVVIYAWEQLINQLPALVRSYGQARFEIGGLVRIHPSKHVFKYGGFEGQGLIRLGCLTKNNEVRKVRADKIICRLEKTTAKMPLGRLETNIDYPDPAPIDILLGTSFFGNLGLIKNEIVLLDTQNGFRQFLESTRLQLNQTTFPMPAIIKLCPFGQLLQPSSTHPSWFGKWDERSPEGEPIVAVTHSAELLAKYCASEPSHSKIIVSNGLSYFKNPQSFDDIIQKQNLILFANHDEDEMIQGLGQRGCRFWWLTQAEINTGIKDAVKYKHRIIGSTMRWANNFYQMKIETEDCDNKDLQEVFLLLMQLEKAVNIDPDGILTKVVKRAWWILNDASAFLGPLEDNDCSRFNEQVSLLRRELRTNAIWIKAEQNQVLSNVANKFDYIFAPESKLGISKGEALKQIINQTVSTGLKYILVTRNANHVTRLVSWLKRHPDVKNTSVYYPSILTQDIECDRVICNSWLGSESMKKVVNSLVAPSIFTVSYPFEKHWLNQFQSHFNRRADTTTITSSEKSGFVLPNTKSYVHWVEDDNIIEPPKPKTEPNLDIWTFEHNLRGARKGLLSQQSSITDSIDSYYVSFVGDSYAYLTETHKIALVNDLISGQPLENHTIPEITVLDLKKDDFVIFPGTGNRELIQEKADQLIGTKATILRESAHLWKDALTESNISPEEFQKRVTDYDIEKQLNTIKIWFKDTSQIGPQKKDDLEIIARITNNSSLNKNIDSVWDAIVTLRSYHLSAGMRLHSLLLQNLPQVLRQVEENGTLISLGEMGDAWVVQVDSVSPTNELRERREVNRLIWDDTNV